MWYYYLNENRVVLFEFLEMEEKRGRVFLGLLSFKNYLYCLFCYLTLSPHPLPSPPYTHTHPISNLFCYYELGRQITSCKFKVKITDSITTHFKGYGIYVKSSGARSEDIKKWIMTMGSYVTPEWASVIEMGCPRENTFLCLNFIVSVLED